MSMSEAEQCDLLKLKTDIEREKHITWDYCKLLLRMDATQLLYAGHRNGNAQAVADTMKRSVERVEKLNKDYIKKYPDER